MIDATRVVPMILSAAILSGCMCLMPMEHMDKEKKDGMKGMGMGEMQGNHHMMGQSAGKESGDISIIFSTVPERPRRGENVLRVKLTDGKTGHSVENAQVVFRFTMMMPGMVVQEAKAMRTQDGVYESRADLSMAGQWDVIVEVTPPAKAILSERFTVIVS